jgi:hypothetical protein
LSDLPHNDGSAHDVRAVDERCAAHEPTGPLFFVCSDEMLTVIVTPRLICACHFPFAAEGVRLELSGSPGGEVGLPPATSSPARGPYAPLSDELRARLREHAKHHSRENVAVMEKLLGGGRGWEEACTLAEAQVGE